MESEDELFLKHEREEAKECFFRLYALKECMIDILAKNHEDLLIAICDKYNHMLDEYIKMRNSREK